MKLILCLFNGHLVGVGASDADGVEQVFQAVRDRPQVQGHFSRHQRVGVVKHVDVAPGQRAVLLHGSTRKSIHRDIKRGRWPIRLIYIVIKSSGYCLISSLSSQELLHLTGKILKFLQEGGRTCEKLLRQLQEVRVIYSKQR